MQCNYENIWSTPAIVFCVFMMFFNLNNFCIISNVVHTGFMTRSQATWYCQSQGLWLPSTGTPDTGDLCDRDSGSDQEIDDLSMSLLKPFCTNDRKNGI